LDSQFGTYPASPPSLAGPAGRIGRQATVAGLLLLNRLVLLLAAALCWLALPAAGLSCPGHSMLLADHIQM